jgi:microcystin degradation protein MlrC
MARAGVIGFLHESNTFLKVPTTWDDFASTSMTSGEEMRSRWADSHHELGGMLSGGALQGLDCIPGFATYAVPSGTIEAESFERIAEALLDSVRRMGEIDGLLVALHGATVSERYRDADGEILSRLRELVGAALPVIVTLDLHANVSGRMAANATAIIAYRTNPHLDQRERGVEAAQLLAAALRGEAVPVMHLETPPLAIPIAAQHTAADPARKLYEEDLAEVLRWPGILSASICMGFYYADVKEMGASFLVVANRNAELARHGARFLAARCWGRRRDLIPALPSVAEAVRHAMSAEAKRPVALMDVGDNVGGGSPANSTVLLEEILRQGARNSLIVLYDPPAVQACVAAGVRNVLSLDLVGEVRVRTLSDGLFTETQVRHGGWMHCDQGVTAVVETLAGRHTVVYTSRRMAPMSLEQLISLGIRAERMDILVVKGAVAPRAAYEPVAGEIVVVDTPGPTANDPKSFSYRHRRVPMFPMEEMENE